MAWNHKSRVVAFAVAIQSVAGTFTTPTSADIIPVAPPSNSENMVSTDDPTATGSIWTSPRVYLGKTANVGATAPLRGPGGVAPPAANAWPLGRVFQAAGYAEVRTATAISGTAQAGGSTTSIILAAGASATDDFYTGMPIQHATIGTGGTIKGNSALLDYNGTSKAGILGETVASAITAGTYNIPPNLLYQLGTLSSAPPLLSVTIWRDKKRYDYRDVRLTSLTFDMPVANEANQVYPSIEFQMKGLPAGVTDATAPTLTTAQLSTIAPYRNGKFCLDKVALGHQSSKFAISADVAGASNAAAAEGQDGYEIMSGNRTLDLDLNQMAVTDFDIDTRVNNQTTVSTMSLWGLAAGNRFVSTCPEIALNPLNNPGDRNGFVNLTGNAAFVGVDKAHTFAVWWD